MLPMKVSSPWMVAAWGASGLARGMASTEYTMSSTKSVRNSAQSWVSPNREYLAITFLRASISASSWRSVIVLLLLLGNLHDMIYRIRQRWQTTGHSGAMPLGFSDRSGPLAIAVEILVTSGFTVKAPQ